MLTSSEISTTWYHTLEEWVNIQYRPWEPLANPRPVAFAPFEAHRPEPFHTLPVVVLVLTERTQNFHREFVQAVDLLRISTAAFRPLLFTDTAQSPAIRSCDWPVEQCIPEEHIPQSENWLAVAANHLRWSVRYFGATYVFAPQNIEQAVSLLEEISKAYNAEPAVRATGITALSHAQTFHDAFGYTSRGAWEQLPQGEHPQTFTSRSGQVLQAVLRKTPQARGVFLSFTRQTDALRDLAQSTGWNSLALDVRSSRSWPFAGRVLKAGAQALANGGATVLVGENIAMPKIDTNLRLTELDREFFMLTVQSKSVRFPTSAAPRVLNAVSKAIKR